jgi:ABC-type uncharacterized transport system substrate-binding protein
LLHAGAEVLVTAGDQLSAAALRETPTVPVVGIGCRVERLAVSLAPPGGNFTGVTCQSFDNVAKQHQLLSDVLAKERQFVALVNPNSRQAAKVTEEIKRAAADLKLVVPLIAARNPEEIEAAFGEIAGWEHAGICRT